jgi:hypothetical protein
VVKTAISGTSIPSMNCFAAKAGIGSLPIICLVFFFLVLLFSIGCAVGVDEDEEWATCPMNLIFLIFISAVGTSSYAGGDVCVHLAITFLCRLEHWSHDIHLVR